MLEEKIINTARDGATFEHFLKHFDSEISRFVPDKVIESLGVNAIQPSFDVKKARTQLIRLNSSILQKGYELVTWSYQLGNARFHKRMSKLNKLHKEITEKLGYMYIDIHSESNKYKLDEIFTFMYPWNNTFWGIKAEEQDYLHCNPVGNQIIAETIARKVFQKELYRDEFGTMKLLDLSKYLIEDKSCKK